MIAVGAVFVLSVIAITVALLPALAATPWLWVAAFVPHALAAALAVRVLLQSDRGEDFIPRAGDLTWGAVTALVLLVGYHVTAAILAPEGSARFLWLHSLYAQLGPPSAIKTSPGLLLLLLGTAVAEEIAWRGLVLSVLVDRLGVRRAAPLTAALYAASMLPSAFLLAVPGVGPNPLVLLAGIGCGLVWSYLTVLTQRLTPAIVSHVAFTWFATVQLRYPLRVGFDLF